MAANDPVLALSDFKPNFYDLLLVDIDMPRINGFELCGKIFVNVRVLESLCYSLDNIYRAPQRRQLAGICGSFQ